MFDAAAIALLLAVSILLQPTALPHSYLIAGLSSAAFLILTLGTLVLERFNTYLADFLTSRSTSSLGRYVSGRLRESADSLALINGRRLLLRLLVTSCLTWLLAFADGWLLLMAAHLPITPSKAVLAYTFPIIVSISPFQAPLGLGTYEASLSAGLLIVGIPTAIAVPTTALLHVAEFSFAAVLALLAGASLIWSRRPSPHRE
jgi:uncharacterized membrane protein YbhN (UPF0104 family)